MDRLTPENRQTILKNLHTYIDTKCIFRANPDVAYFEGLPRGHLHAASPTKTNKSLFVMRNLTHNPVMMNCVSVLFLDWLLKTLSEGKEYSRI